MRHNIINNPKWFLIVTCILIYSCNSSDKKNNETKILVENKNENTNNDQLLHVKEKLNLKPVKSNGVSVVVGEDIKFFDVNQIEIDFIPKYGEIFEILDISKDKYPKETKNHCERYPYIHITNHRINGWISGKYVYRINDEPEKKIEISNEPFLIYKSKSFGIASVDSTGSFTGCLDYFPILLKSVKSDTYHIIHLAGENPLHHNIQCLVFYDTDKFINVISDSNYTVLQIKTEGMEGGYTYDIKLRKFENGIINGEIDNVEEWTY